MKPASFATAGIPLRTLLANELGVCALPDVRVTSCTSEWQQVRPGDVFVAITSDDCDGHNFADKAAKRGAAAIICERPVPVFNIPQCVVTDSRRTYGQICQALLGDPSQQMKVIGITGSHGKTTVARLLSAVLREAGAIVGTFDSYGYWDGVEEHPPIGDHLSPPVLARSLAEMAASGVTHAVVEISSYDLAHQTFAGVSLDAVCITHVGRNHIDVHGTVENYRAAKRRIFEHMSSSAVAILNADDKFSVEMLDRLECPALTYGMKGSSEISAQVIEQHVNEQLFLVSAGDDTVGMRTEIVGDHHIYSCLAAATTALAFGVELTTIARGLESVDYLPGRMERVKCGQGFSVLVDSADTPEALRNCLRAARKTTRGRVICVFGAKEDVDTNDLPAIGRVIGAMSEKAAITNGRLAEFGAHRTCLEVRSGFADMSKVQVILDRQEAIQWALSEARGGDTVVIAGMGAEPHTPVGATGEMVSDSEIVRTALRNQPVTKPHRLAA